MLKKRRAQKHIRKMDLSEIRLKYIRKLTGYGAFSLPLALQDATRLGVGV